MQSEGNSTRIDFETLKLRQLSERRAKVHEALWRIVEMANQPAKPVQELSR